MSKPSSPTPNQPSQPSALLPSEIFSTPSFTSTVPLQERVKDGFEDFTIDLGALGEKPSSVIVEDRDQGRDEMPSEDDGPEDFTLNMAKWMKGDDKWVKKEDIKAKEDDPKDKNGPCDDESLSEKLERDFREIDNHVGGFEEESLFEPAASSTPQSQRNIEVESEPLQSQDQLLAQAGQQFEETKGHGTEEEIFRRISALQTEVESMRTEEENMRRDNARMSQENELMKIQRDQAQRKLGEWDHQTYINRKNDHLRLEQVREQLQDANNNRAALEAELEDTRDRLQQADDTATTLEAELEDLRHNHSEELDSVRALLEQQKLETEHERSKSLTIAHEAAKLAETRQHNEVAIQKLSAEVEKANSELENGCDQLRESRRISEEVENENESLRQEVSRQSKELSYAQEQLQDKFIELQAAHASIAELQAKGASNEEDAAEEAAEAATERSNREHSAIVASLKVQHAKERSLLTAALKKAGQTHKTREAALKESHESQMLQLQNQIKSLEHQVAEQNESSTHSVEDELRSAIRVLSTKLEKSHQATRVARADAEAARQEALSMKEMNDAVNAELELRFVEATRQRENEWMRRANLLFKDRDRMGRVLLQSWGREEMGAPEEGDKQAYRYKYVKGRF